MTKTLFATGDPLSSEVSIVTPWPFALAIVNLASTIAVCSAAHASTNGLVNAGY